MPWNINRGHEHGWYRCSSTNTRLNVNIARIETHYTFSSELPHWQSMVTGTCVVRKTNERTNSATNCNKQQAPVAPPESPLLLRLLRLLSWWAKNKQVVCSWSADSTKSRDSELPSVQVLTERFNPIRYYEITECSWFVTFYGPHVHLLRELYCTWYIFCTCSSRSHELHLSHK